MDITTRISTKAAPSDEHHYECTRDHPIVAIRFTSCSPKKGFGHAETRDCMFYEIEDAAAESVIEAFDTSDGINSGADYESAREAATILAERADGLLTGAKAHVRHTVEAA